MVIPLAVVFTPIHQARASGEIVSQIERAIFAGELRAGDRLQSERELAEARTVVEAATAALAAQRADAAAVSRLAQNVQQGRAVIRDSMTHAEASMDFHVELARAADNEVLYATVAAYRELLVPALREVRNPSTVRTTQKAHEELVEAVRRHDAQGARELMVSHLADFEKRLRKRLQEREEERMPTTNIRRLVRPNGARR